VRPAGQHVQVKHLLQGHLGRRGVVVAVVVAVFAARAVLAIAVAAAVATAGVGGAEESEGDPRGATARGEDPVGKHHCLNTHEILQVHGRARKSETRKGKFRNINLICSQSASEGH